MTAPSTRGFRVQAGATSPVTNDHGFDIRGFTAGQLLYFGFYYLATRVSGTDTVTLTSKVRWWDKNDVELTPTTAALTYNASTANFTFYEGAHAAPANAVRGRINFTLSSSAATFGLTTIITAIRVAKTQNAADVTSQNTALGDANRVRYSQLEAGLKGFGLMDVTAGLSTSTNSGTSSLSGVQFYQGVVSFTANNQTAALGNDPYMVPVVAGERLFVGAGLQTALAAAGTWSLQIGWINASGVEIGARVTVASGTGSLSPFPARRGGFANVPDGAVKAFLRFAIFNQTSGAATNVSFSWGQIQVCSAGPGQTTWPAFTPGPSADPAATVGAQVGTNLLNPDGSAITSADNKLVGLGQNVLVNSDFSRVGNNLFGWVPSWGGNVVNGVASWGYNLVTTPNYFGQLNVAYTAHSYNGTAGQGGVFDSHYHVPNSNDPQAVTDLQRWALPVQDGDRVFASALLAVHRCTAQLYLQFFDGTGNASNTTFNHDSVSGNQGRVSGGANGDPANFDQATWFVDVPSGARFAVLRIRATTIDGQANPYIFYTQMMLCKVAPGQTIAPPYAPGPSSDPGAEVNRWIVGPPQSTVFNYDYTGAAQAGEFTRTLTFTLMTSSGAVTSGVSWTNRIVNGGYNGATSAGGSFTMPVSGGVGSLNVVSMQSSSATVEVTANYNGQVYTKQFTITQNIAAPPTGGGSGTTTLASRASGFSSIASTTFTDVTGTSTPLVGTIPAGKTSAAVNVLLNASPGGGTTGNWTVECKVMRDVGGTPTQVGTTQSALSDWNSVDVSGDEANFTFTISDTGLTAGTAYNWRIYMRLTSGTRTHSITGTVSVTA